MMHAPPSLQTSRGARYCRICGRNDPDSWTCSDCREVARLIPQIPAPLVLIVDGSYRRNSREAGAGLILVHGSLTGDFIAFCACRFMASSSTEAERQAVIRGLRWAPGVPVHTDALNVAHEFARRGENVSWLPLGAVRVPNHQFAHRLSVEGRLAHHPGTPRRSRDR